MRGILPVLTVMLIFGVLPTWAETPQNDALMLVLTTQEKEIEKLDPHNKPIHNGETKWWFDTDAREWSVKRPIAPGIIDSTHSFVVSLKVGGRLVGSWNVDTRSKRVSKSDLSKTSEPGSKSPTAK